MKAIIYARVSSESDRQNTDRQTVDLNTYAQAQNIEIVKEYTEHISGAKRNADRPILMAAIDYAVQNKIDIVLFSELSRLGRSVYEVQEIVKILVDNGVNAYFLKENISLLNSDGTQSMITPIIVTVLGVCAAIERENIAYRLASGRRNAIANGVRMGRKVGYRQTKKEKKEKYGEIIKRLEKGDKMTDIAAWAKGKGIKCSLATIKRLKKEFAL